MKRRSVSCLLLSVGALYTLLRSAFPPPKAEPLQLRATHWERVNASERILVATLLTDDFERYGRGALALRRSIRGAPPNVEFKLFVLDTRPIADAGLRARLEAVGWTLATLPRVGARLGAEPHGRYVDQFSKLGLWRLVEYDRVLYLDSDCLVVGSLDEALAIDVRPGELWVTRDIMHGFWQSGFNMGVFMIRPSLAENARLMAAKDDARVQYDQSMCEQGLLNVVYHDTWREIGFRNNANLAAYIDDRPLWQREAAQGLNVIHYTIDKPWTCVRLRLCALWHDLGLGARPP